MVDLLHSLKPSDSTDMVTLGAAVRHTVAEVDVDQELARAVDLAEAENVVELAVSRQKWRTDLQVSWLWTEHAIAVFAGCDTHLTSAMLTRTGTTGGEIASIQKFFVELGATPTVHVPSFDTEAHHLLRASGYRNVGSTEVVFHSLDDLPPVDFTSVELLSVEQTSAWIESLVFTDDYGPERLEPGSLVAAMKGAQKFAVLANGQIAGGGSMRLVDDVALLFCDAIAPEYRSRGLHRAVINARLNAAKSAGVRIASAFVQLGSISQSNYLSIGFKRLYCRDTYQLTML
jgi:N-acetylglutamate synthase-like GNAT family acetyltransferase